MTKGDLEFFNLSRDDVEWSQLLPVEELADQFGASIDPDRALVSSEISHKVIGPIVEKAGWEDKGFQFRVGREAGGSDVDAERYPTLIPVGNVSLDADFVVVENNWRLRDPESRHYPIIGEIKEPQARHPKELLKKAVDDASKYARFTVAPYGLITNGRYVGIVLPLRDPNEALLKSQDVDLYEALLRPANLLDEAWRNDFMLRANITDPDARAAEAKDESQKQTLIATRPISEIAETLTSIYKKVKSDIHGIYDVLEDTEEVSDSYQSWLELRASMPSTMREQDTFLQETVYDLTIKLLTLKVTRDYDLLQREDPDQYVYDGLPNSLREYVAEIQGTQSILPAIGMDVLSWWIPTQNQFDDMADDQQEEVEERIAAISTYLSNAQNRLDQFDTTELDRDQIGYIYEKHLPAERRRVMGEYYTPVKIVDNVLAETGYGNLNQDLREKTILDSSCGSGTFLVRASRNLRAWLEIREGLEVETQEDAERVLKLIEENIRGLDINPFAVTLAEINLFLTNIDIIQLADRDKIEFNIYATDSLERGEHESGPLNRYIDRGNHRALKQRSILEGAEKLKDDRHDFVVGNPPYTSRYAAADYGDVLDQYDTDNTATAFWKRIKRDFTTDNGAIGLVMPMDFVTGYAAGEEARNWLKKRDMEVIIIDPTYYEQFHKDSRIAKVSAICQK